MLKSLTLAKSGFRIISSLTVRAGPVTRRSNSIFEFVCTRPEVLQARCYSSEKKDPPKGDYIDQNSELQKILRDLYDEPIEQASKPAPKVPQEPSGSLMHQNYKYFDEDESGIIYDIDEERQLNLQTEKKKIDLGSKFSGISQTRGATGVFDLTELVELLRREKCSDICVVSVPPDKNYVDHLIVCTCVSSRHLSAVADFVRKVFKMKRNESDRIPTFEGNVKNTDWVAADLGNIALHLFLQETREVYDLESLWALGPEFDEQSQIHSKIDEDIFYNNSLLADLKPASKQ